MDARTLAKLIRLLKKFPEIWVHTREVETVDGVSKTFHHVEYRSNLAGRSRVRLVAHVSSDMCELLVLLKQAVPELVEAVKSGETPSKRRDV